MPSPKYSGNPGGAGNPPGQHSSSYLSDTEDKGHFTTDKSYRGTMHVGISETAKEVGNDVKDSKISSIESFSNKTNSI